MDTSTPLTHIQSFLQQGAYTQAITFSETLLKEPKTRGYGYEGLGLVAFCQNDLAVAVSYLQQAVAAIPNQAIFHCNLGIALQTNQALEEARKAFLQAIELDANMADAWRNLGLVDFDRHEPELALSSLQKAKQLNPRDPGILFGGGNVLKHLKRHEEALEWFRRAIVLAPESEDIWNNLGTTLLEMHYWAEAEACFRRVLSVNPHSGKALSNLGLALLELGRFNEALICHEKAVALLPDNPCAIWNRGEARLLMGQWQSGWMDYEYRWQGAPASRPYRYPSETTWQGSVDDLQNKKLLIWHEQGHGDTLNYIRFVPELLQHADRVIVTCQDSLLSLLQRNFPGVSFVATLHYQGEYDLHIPLMSLGSRLQITPNQLKGDAYLTPDPKRREYVFQSFRTESRLKVGITWVGNPLHPRDARRSIPLETLQPLWSIPDICWVFMGKEYPDPAIQIPVIDVSHSLNSYEDTAALIAHLDLVITVDTSVAHLSGALGKDTWLCLPYHPDWRWGYAGKKTPWYSSIQIIRQPLPGEWSWVIEEVKKSLLLHLSRSALT